MTPAALRERTALHIPASIWREVWGDEYHEAHRDDYFMASVRYVVVSTHDPLAYLDDGCCYVAALLDYDEDVTPTQRATLRRARAWINAALSALEAR